MEIWNEITTEHLYNLADRAHAHLLCAKRWMEYKQYKRTTWQEYKVL